MALDWKIFTQRPYIKSLSLEEQIRLFRIANEKSIRLRESKFIDFANSNSTSQGAAGDGITGPTFTNRFALNFDGTDDFVATDTAVTSYLNGVSQMSLSIWFNLDVAAQNKGLISDRNFSSSATNGHFSIATKNASGGNYSFRIYLTHPDSVEASIQISNQPFTEGQWHNLIMTFNAGTVKFYADGSFASSAIYDAANGIPTTLGSTAKSLDIGRYVSLEWDGKIDEPAIYLTELTSDQVTTIYNGGVPGDISSLNPVAWYRFEEGSGTTAIDAGSGGNDATINGATYTTDIPT